MTHLSSQARLLLVEDEPSMRRVLGDTLAAEGYRVMTASTGPEGLARALEQKPDLVLLDVMLPGQDGFSVCRDLRAQAFGAPILMLTARGLVEDRVEGLDSGADDYLIKPFSGVELLARVRALLRRAERSGRVPGAISPAPLAVTLGEVSIDLIRRRVTKRGSVIPMTAKEFGTLSLLAENPGRLVTRDEFLDLVWGHGAFPTTRTVDTHIARLRAKLEPDPTAPRYIITVPKQGYRLEGVA